MQVVTGIVGRIRNTAEVSGNKHGIGTTQVLGFRIGRQSVELRMPSLPPIEDGDEVAVAGEMHDGILVARAYKNFDNNARGRWHHSWVVSAIISAVFFFPVIAIFASVFLRGGSEYPLAILIYLVPFAPFPFWAASGFVEATKTSHAARMVRDVE